MVQVENLPNTRTRACTVTRQALTIARHLDRTRSFEQEAAERQNTSFPLPPRHSDGKRFYSKLLSATCVS